jgi:hypothetical protein
MDHDIMTSRHKTHRNNKAVWHHVEMIIMGHTTIAVKDVTTVLTPHNGTTTPNFAITFTSTPAAYPFNLG